MKLAVETGGGYFEPSKASDLVSTVERIDQELRSQYLLAFRSRVPDGRAHRLRVRMRVSTFKVRVRRKLGERLLVVRTAPPVPILPVG
jgi:hypothetical protein